MHHKTNSNKEKSCQTETTEFQTQLVLLHRDCSGVHHFLHVTNAETLATVVSQEQKVVMTLISKLIASIFFADNGGFSGLSVSENNEQCHCENQFCIMHHFGLIEQQKIPLPHLVTQRLSLPMTSQNCHELQIFGTLEKCSLTAIFSTTKESLLLQFFSRIATNVTS